MFKRLHKLNVFWKRVIMFGILFVLAVPLLIFIGNSFQKRVTKFDKQGFLEELNLPEFKEEIGSSFEELEEELRKLEEIATTTTTTTYAEEETNQTIE